jgi:hypothetical protein
MSRRPIGIGPDRAAASRPRIPKIAQTFLASLRWLFVGTVSESGAIHASLLSGSNGCIEADDQQIHIHCAIPPMVRSDIAANHALALLALDFESRRRLRANGRGIMSNGTLTIEPREVYGNCPKYIQSRTLAGDGVIESPSWLVGPELSAAEQQWIGSADTFVIASGTPATGLDVSHRGGYPGFVDSVSSRTLSWLEYPGNRLFQTQDNLLASPKTSLLFLDFQHGRTLQIQGEARLRKTESGAIRVRLTVHEVIVTTGATPLRWRFLEYSAANPPVTCPANEQLQLERPPGGRR